MPKLKPNKGVLKRVKITAKGKVKWQRAFKSHLNSHMSGSKIMKLRGKRLAGRGDIPRLERMLKRRLKAADAGDLAPRAEKTEAA